MRTVPTRRRLAGVAATATAAVVLLAGCGDDSTPTTSGQDNGQPTPTASVAPGMEHNEADITFAQGMIPHHQQAIAMADLATTRAATPRVKDLAAKIKAAQGPEIEEMTNWLTDWGATVPPSGMPGHDMGSGATAMPGMMSDQDMTALDTATGAAFDRMFLQMMIIHHQGAVQMAQTEQQQGRNPGAKALAQQIETDQNAEIQQMQTMLGTL